MNMIQMAILAFVAVVILFTLCYYWYDDIRFKRKVEDSFNQSTKDVLITDEQAVVLDAIEAKHDDANMSKMHKDIADIKFDSADAADNLTDAAKEDLLNHALDVPDDSAEAFFVKLDKIAFPFAKWVNRDLDLVIDIVFEEPKKIKLQPDIAQFTNKHFSFYVLDKDDKWNVFEKNKKYFTKAIKLVVQLLDKEGIISQAQVANIYQELHKFVINNNAHIRCSDYEQGISYIQSQLKNLSTSELVLELYLLTKEKIPYPLLAKFFAESGLSFNEGAFRLLDDDKHVVFSISGENKEMLVSTNDYALLLISSPLHLQSDPLAVLDKIFDLSEGFMAKFESRILSANKQVLGQREYDQLYNFVKSYMANAVKKQVHLGGELIRRALG